MSNIKPGDILFKRLKCDAKKPTKEEFASYRKNRNKYPYASSEDTIFRFRTDFSKNPYNKSMPFLDKDKK